MSKSSGITRREQITWVNDDVHFVLDQHALLDFYSSRSMKQQSANRPVAPLGHIILIPIQPIITLTSSAENQQILISLSLV